MNKRLLILLGVVYAIMFLMIIVCIINPFNNECIEGDCVNEYGVYMKHSGMRYEGEWKNGERHGKGILTYPDNYTYDGEWKNNRMHGYGVKLKTDGWRYEGQWKNGHQHGKGTLSSLSGYIYEGEWEIGKRHGIGTQTHTNGWKYEGEWKDNLQDGKGVMTCKDGTTLKGTWIKDELLYETIILITPNDTNQKVHWNSEQMRKCLNSK